MKNDLVQYSLKTLITLFLFIVCLTISGQSAFNYSDMSVNRNDLKTNTFEQDSTAGAVVLYEYGNSYVKQGNNNLTVEIKRKIKILNKSQLKRANIEIPIYVGDSKEKVQDIKATTYNLENGEVVISKLEKNQIFTENYNERYDIVKFLLPNVKEGSVITYSYTFTTPYFNKFYSWEFQEDLPKLYSEYNTSIPGNYEYHIKLIGSKPLDVNDQRIENMCIDYGRVSANCTVSKYVMQDIPAFINEDYLTSPKNYRSRIEYELKTIRHFDGEVKQYTATWESTDKELRSAKNLGAQLKGNSNAINNLPDQIKNEKDQSTKAKLIHKYIQENFIWNGVNRSYDESVSNLLKEGSGTATEINMLLHNTLKAQGLEAQPVLLSTRENGLPTKLYPVITEFNYLIVLLDTDDGKFFLDATNPFMAFGEIPFKCLNQYGRALDTKYGSYWVDIDPKKPSTIQIKTELEFKNAKELSGTYNTTSTGYKALPYRQAHFENKNEYVENLDNKLINISISNHKVLNPDKSSYDFVEEAEIKWELETISNNIYLNPILVNFYNSNPFKLQERTYPIDFGYKQAYLYNLKIKLNNLFTVKELPKEISYKLPNNAGNILFKTDYNDDEVNLYFRFNINGTIFNYEYYEYFKEFFGKIIDINNNSLILLELKQT